MLHVSLLAILFTVGSVSKPAVCLYICKLWLNSSPLLCVQHSSSFASRLGTYSSCCFCSCCFIWFLALAGFCLPAPLQCAGVVELSIDCLCPLEIQHCLKENNIVSLSLCFLWEGCKCHCYTEPVTGPEVLLFWSLRPGVVPPSQLSPKALLTRFPCSGETARLPRPLPTELVALKSLSARLSM